jgi:Rod binding domain-containing protein
MNVSLTPTSSFPVMPASGKAKAEKAAQDFESVLLASLLQSLQESFAPSSEEDSAGSSHYSLMATQALASALSAHGGIGIGGMILRQWQQTKVPEVSAPEVASAS